MIVDMLFAREVLLASIMGLGAAVFVTARHGPGSWIGAKLSKVIPGKWASCIPCVAAWAAFGAGLWVDGIDAAVAAWFVAPALWWARTGTHAGGCSTCGESKPDIKERKRAEHAAATGTLQP